MRERDIEVLELRPAVSDLEDDPLLDEAVRAPVGRMGIVHPGHAGKDLLERPGELEVEIDGLGETVVYPAHH